MVDYKNIFSTKYLVKSSSKKISSKADPIILDRKYYNFFFLYFYNYVLCNSSARLRKVAALLNLHIF